MYITYRLQEGPYGDLVLNTYSNLWGLDHTHMIFQIRKRSFLHAFFHLPPTCATRSQSQTSEPTVLLSHSETLHNSEAVQRRLCTIKNNQLTFKGNPCDQRW